jgi:hypothetical protein
VIRLEAGWVQVRNNGREPKATGLQLPMQRLPSFRKCYDPEELR